MQPIDIVVLVLAVGVVGYVIVKAIVNKKKGVSGSCGCASCQGCRYSASCPSCQNDKEN